MLSVENKPIMLSVILLPVVMLSVIMLNVVVMSVVAPLTTTYTPIFVYGVEHGSTLMYMLQPSAVDISIKCLHQIRFNFSQLEICRWAPKLAIYEKY